ncbi:hypothetical protein [Methylacidiphilum kamchatkense]|uniref:hypothetical protein n=1 Tax=Methylacidiphilum kamchatkense TaxID=431057 RepID=UPI000AFB8D7F|nr:hypothetical protein [Methylacidiphilum kamchatkense]
MSRYFSSTHALSDGGRFLIVGLPGTKLTQEQIETIRDVQPAGFIFFSSEP